MSPVAWAFLPLRRYADFSGRSPRAEYWWYALATTLLGSGCDYLHSLFSAPHIGVYGPAGLIFTLATFIPTMTVTIRRFHDIDRTGWWILLELWSYALIAAGFDNLSIESVMKSMSAPVTLIVALGVVVSAVLLLVFMVTRGTVGPNRYGPDPYGRDVLEEVFA